MSEGGEADWGVLWGRCGASGGEGDVRYSFLWAFCSSQAGGFCYKLLAARVI